MLHSGLWVGNQVGYSCGQFIQAEGRNAFVKHKHVNLPLSLEFSDKTRFRCIWEMSSDLNRMVIKIYAVST